MRKENKGQMLDKLKSKYRLSIRNDISFEEVWFIRLSRLNLMALTGGLSLILISVVYFAIAYTSIREFIPGYPDGDTRRNIYMNALKVDSLERELALRDQYLANINSIIRGNPIDYAADQDSIVMKPKQIVFTKSYEDSVLREQIESEEPYTLSIQTQKATTPFSSLHFFPPVKGIITNAFKPEQGHFGVDLVSQPNQVVNAILPGTIIEAAWTLETGYVIQIQHSNNIISVYKHNAELLKKTGNRVEAGEAIAIVGNSGELSSGQHLHFELWHNGTPINPEDYIAF